MKKVLDTIKKLPGIVGRFILKYSKYFFPGFALIIAAIVVVVALDQKQKSVEREKEREAQLLLEQQQVAAAQLEATEVPLKENDDERVRELIENYYLALTNGDTDLLLSVCENIDESEVIRLSEQSKYVAYTVDNIYSQAGLEEGSFIVYAYCMVVFNKYPDYELPAYNGLFIRTNESGDLVIEKGELTDEENDYISKVASQDDVTELNNKINVDYNDIVLEHPEILDYLIELDQAVSTSVGERIAEINATIEAQQQEEEQGEEVQEEEVVDTEPEVPVVIYATATTVVNIRASDSANAERVGEARTGDRFEVIEELVNGWTKIKYNDTEAFIKSDYLSMIQSSAGQPTIGMLTAKSEVNIRSLPDSNSEKVGALIAGDQLEIVAVEDGWCTVKFEDMLAYVNEEFVDCTIFE